MGKSTYFIGQLIQQAARLDETPENHRFHPDKPVLKPYFQRCGTQPQNEKEKWGVTLMVDLFLPLLQRSVKRPWSLSGLAILVRIMLMYYADTQEIHKNIHLEKNDTAQMLVYYGHYT